MFCCGSPSASGGPGVSRQTSGCTRTNHVPDPHRRPAFLLYNMARSKQPHDAIRQRALELQAAFAEWLTAQDTAAINLLLQSLGPAGL